jgi:uracil-DNA glycosylase
MWVCSCGPPTALDSQHESPPDLCNRAGYNVKGSDLPPPPICARTWPTQALALVPKARLTVLIGGHAIPYHLPKFTTVTQAVLDWDKHPKGVFALPHPSWRNTGWLKKNPWFEADVIPRPQAAVAEVM